MALSPGARADAAPDAATSRRGEGGEGGGGRKHLADLFFAGVLIAAGLGAVVMATGYPRDSGIYPITIGLGLAGLGGLILVRGLVAGSGGDRNTDGGSCGGRFTINPLRFALGLMLIGGYVAALSRLGFVLPSLVLAIAMPIAAGYRRPLVAGLTGLATVTAIIAIFVVALSRPLPADPILGLLGLQR